MTESVRKRPFSSRQDIHYVAIRDFESSERKFKLGDKVDGLPKRRLRRLYRKNLGRSDDPYTQAVLQGKVGKTITGAPKSFAPKKFVDKLIDSIKNIGLVKVTAKSNKSDLLKYAEQLNIAVDPEATNKVIWETIQENK